MYTDHQHLELVAFIDKQFAKLGQLLSSPIEPHDTVFVTHALPTWLGEQLEHRFNVLPSTRPEPALGPFILSMDIDFGTYHRRMELTAGSGDDLRRYATEHAPSRQVAEAILQLLTIERAGTSSNA